jgi:predicted pyridoxine 5'-phosphate oxidase superfamily flavin-nucleotide-binding protein
VTVDDRADVTIADLRRCFSGAVPAVLTTASLDGVPNVTYLSRVQQVDDERIALSNQFFSKTARNLAENPRAQMLLIDPVSHDEYRLDIVYERTERRGPVFERLRADVDAIAALTGMQDVFKLRAADIYRIVDLRQVEPSCRKSRAASSRPPAGSPSCRCGSRDAPIWTPSSARPSTASRTCSATSTACSCSSTRTAVASTRSPATATTARAWAPRW